MGATFCYRVYEGTLEEVKEEWKSDVESDLYSHGHEYSGSIGMLGECFILVKETFDDVDKAVEHIEENHGKWDDAMCCKTKNEEYVIGGWCSS